MLKKIILSTRPMAYKEEQVLFSTVGLETWHLPLAEIVRLPLTQQAQTAIRSADWLFFTSQIPVSQILPYSSPKAKIAVIGAKTASEVAALGKSVSFVSQAPTKAAMIEEWHKLQRRPQQIFYAKSQLADDLLEKQLITHHVISCVTYHNQSNEANAKELRKLLQMDALHGVYLTSPSIVDRFYAVYKDFLDVSLELIALGETTKQQIESYGLTATLLSVYMNQC